MGRRFRSEGEAGCLGQGGAPVPDPCASAPQMIRMSTGHMEGNLQLLYVLLTDCYVYLLRKGACRPQARPGQLPRARGGRHPRSLPPAPRPECH